MKRRLSLLCVLLMAISVIAAGIGVGHAGGVQLGGMVHIAPADHDMAQADMPTPGHRHQPDCMSDAQGMGKPGTMKHGATTGCCHIASFPSVAANDLPDLSRHAFTSERPTAPRDELAVANDPEGRLRPPRA